MMEKLLVDQKTATKRSYNRFVDARNNDWDLLGIDTGIHQLNMLIGGWVPGKLTTIAGRSGMGKTAITVPAMIRGSIPRPYKRFVKAPDGSMKVTDRVRRAEFMYCTWEMSPSYLVDRIVSSYTHISTTYLGQGARLLSPAQEELVKEAYGKTAKLPIHYQEMSLDIKRLMVLCEEFCEMCKEKEKIEGIDILPVIFIDYLGLASFEGSSLRTYGIGDFMIGLKQVANATGCAIGLMAQINRSSDKEDEPNRSHLADSQSIEMTSDNLVIIHRPEYLGQATMQDPASGNEIDSSGMMLIKTEKSRDYGQGKVVCCHEISKYAFWDPQHHREYDYYELYKREDFWRSFFSNRH